MVSSDVGNQADILSSLMDAAFQMAPGAEHVAALLVDAQGARWVEASHAAKVVGCRSSERKLIVEQRNCKYGNQLAKRAMFYILRLAPFFYSEFWLHNFLL